MFQMGEQHGKALGMAFQKEHSSLRRRFSFVLDFLTPVAIAIGQQASCWQSMPRSSMQPLQK